MEIAGDSVPVLQENQAFLVASVTGIGILIATPVGVMAGTFLAEYGRGSKLAALIRFLNDVLLSAPSILIGLFVYTLMVRPMGTYSGWAGGVALRSSPCR